jgi:outer membrane immunogenic protein
MRRLLVALGLIGLISPAFAADYELPILYGSPPPVPILPASSTPTYVVGPPPIRVFTWTGCYLGVHAGGASVDNQFNGQTSTPLAVGAPTLGFADPVIPIGLNATPATASAALAAAGYAVPTGLKAGPTVGAISSNGVNVGNGGGGNPLFPAMLGGAQAGCDVQFAKHWVVGVSADAAGANSQGSTAQTNSFGLIGPVPVTTSVNSSGSLNAQTNFIATFTGRFGYSMGAWPGLFYVKGGGAYEQSSYSFRGNVASTSCAALTPLPLAPPFPSPSCATFNPTVNQQFNFGTSTDSRLGWTIGIGTEWMVYGGLSVFGEYNYLDFGTRPMIFSDPNLGSYEFNVKQHFNVFKLGVNYRFNVEVG